MGILRRSTEACSSGLRQRTVALFLGYGARTGLQALQFFLLARLLGADEFGRVAAANALITIAVPLAGLGFGNVLLMEVSRQRASAPTQYANALLAVLLIGLVLTLALCFVAYGLYGRHTSLVLILTLGAGELLLMRICTITGQLFQAIDRTSLTSLINAVATACRALAAALLIFFPNPSAEVWAATSFVLLFVVTLGTVWTGVSAAGGLRPSYERARRNLGDAAHFALGLTAKAVYTDLDKVLIGKFNESAVLGAYAAAYRVTVMAFTPVRALLDAAAANLFKIGAQDGEAAWRSCLRLMRWSGLWGLTVGAALLACAPLLPIILGPSFAPSVSIVRALAILPAIQSVHYVFSDFLTVTGRQHIRTRLQYGVLGLYVLLGLSLIPTFGWPGAVATCLLSEGVLAVAVVSVARSFATSGGTGDAA